MDKNEFLPSDESQPEDLTVEEMINVCRGRVPDELLEGAEWMEPDELLGLLVGELPNHGIKDPISFLFEARKVVKVWPAIEIMFDLLHDKGINKDISAAEFAHLHGITSKFIQAPDLDSIVSETEIPPQAVEQWRQNIEATRQKLIIAQISGQIIGRVNIFKEAEGSIEPVGERATTIIGDLWLHPDFYGQRVEDYLILAAENYVVNTPALPRRSAVLLEPDSVLLEQTASRLGYERSEAEMATKELRWKPTN